MIKRDFVTETVAYGAMILHKLLAKMSVLDMTLPMLNITLHSVAF